MNYQAYCDMSNIDGGWTVIQKRFDGSVDFFRDWPEYKKGFGNKLGEYWLGLDIIHALTSQADNILKIEMTCQGQTKLFTYNTFKVASEVEKYRLSIGAYQGKINVPIVNVLKVFSKLTKRYSASVTRRVFQMSVMSEKTR